MNRTGVVLSGGGARAMAQLGFLQALEEQGERMKWVCGVSAGALIGALYASNMECGAIRERVTKQKWRELFALSFRGGIFHLERGVSVLEELLEGARLETLPLRIGVTDLSRGEFVGLETGSVARAVVASCTIPPLARPMEWGGSQFADGGITNNLPAHLIRNQCDFLLGLNVNPKTPLQRSGITTYAIRAGFLLLYANMREGIALCDDYLEFGGVEYHSIFSLKALEPCFEIGYTQGRNYTKRRE